MSSQPGPDRARVAGCSAALTGILPPAARRTLALSVGGFLLILLGVAAYAIVQLSSLKMTISDSFRPSVYGSGSSATAHAP